MLMRDDEGWNRFPTALSQQRLSVTPAASSFVHGANEMSGRPALMGLVSAKKGSKNSVQIPHLISPVGPN